MAPPSGKIILISFEVDTAMNDLSDQLPSARKQDRSYARTYSSFLIRLEIQDFLKPIFVRVHFSKASSGSEVTSVSSRQLLAQPYGEPSIKICLCLLELLAATMQKDSAASVRL
jgi:hypothetical protein